MLTNKQNSLLRERDAFVAQIAQLRPRTIEVDISPEVSCSHGALTFDHSLSRRHGGRKTVFHIHVPKTAGTTVSQLFRQNGYWQLSLDDFTNDFFSVVNEQSWFDRAARDSHLFSGHYRLDHSIFHRVPGPHFIVTTLRHPIQRMLSYYNFSGRHPIMTYHADIAAGRISVVEYAEFMLSASGPQYWYFSDRGSAATAKECLENLFTRVSFFGLTERFSEFATIIGYLFDLENVLVVNSGKVTSEMKNPEDAPLKTTLTDEETAKLSALLEDDLWFYTAAREEYERRIAEPQIKTLLAAMVPLNKACMEAAQRARAARQAQQRQSTASKGH